MASKSNKYYRVRMVGTGLNEELLVSAHDIVSMPASTYHKFTFPDGRVLWKNDFGISTVIVFPVEMSPDDYDAEVTRMVGSPR